MKYKITYLLIILLLSSCGFTPIYSNKNSNFNVEKVTSNLNNSLTNYIENSLFSFSNTNASQSLNIEITLKEEIIVILKDSKGDPSKKKLTIIVNLKVKNHTDKFLIDKNFKEEFSYDVQSDKFSLGQYEDNITINLNNKISNDIIFLLGTLE